MASVESPTLSVKIASLHCTSAGGDKHVTDIATVLDRRIPVFVFQSFNSTLMRIGKSAAVYYNLHK